MNWEIWISLNSVVKLIASERRLKYEYHEKPLDKAKRVVKLIASERRLKLLKKLQLDKKVKVVS